MSFVSTLRRFAGLLVAILSSTVNEDGAGTMPAVDFDPSVLGAMSEHDAQLYTQRPWTELDVSKR